MSKVLQTGLSSTGRRSAATWRSALGPRLLVGLAGVLSLLLSACGSSSNSVSFSKNQTFSWPLVGSGVQHVQYDEVLDPATVSTAWDDSQAAMLYTSLVTFDNNLNVIPDAALKWDVTGNGTIYTFHLRPGMKFSDGTSLTAADFAYSINRALDPNLCVKVDAKTYGPNAGGECTADPTTTPPSYPIAASYLNYILGAQNRLAGTASTLIGQGDDATKGLDVMDDQTLRIRITSPVGFFLEALTYPTAMPVERKLVDDPANAGGTWVNHLDQGGCSGPWMVKSYGNNGGLVMVPNPYWQQAWNKKLTLTEVDRPIALSSDVSYHNYQQGQYDLTPVPTNQYSFARSQDDFNEVPTLTTRYFGLNWDRPPFDNLLVRRAFALSLNKQLLVDRVENGGATPTNHIVPRGMPGYYADLKNPPPDGTQSLTGNQAAAVNDLKQAIQTCTSATPGVGTASASLDYCPYIVNGAKSQPIVLDAPKNATQDDLASSAAQLWTSVLGVNVQVNIIEKGYYNNLYPGSQAQAWIAGWIADYPDPQDWLTLQFTGGANNSNNFSDVNQADLNSLLQQADVQQDSTKRYQMYNQAEQQIIDNVAWIPIQQEKLYWRQRTWVHGFSQDQLGLMIDLNWSDVYIAQH
ncbi:MAG TPA: peptide ABC transporter substrate-binding protein [Ktedonobacterales bacterium]|nr:peptide ABC transporter substrate-binding protein [Ktedonobacterales bacterium]